MAAMLDYNEMVAEVRQHMEMRMKEHQDACERGIMEKPAVVEHEWENHHRIHWEKTTAVV